MSRLFLLIPMTASSDDLFKLGNAKRGYEIATEKFEKSMEEWNAVLNETGFATVPGDAIEDIDALTAPADPEPEVDYGDAVPAMVRPDYSAYTTREGIMIALKVNGELNRKEMIKLLPAGASTVYRHLRSLASEGQVTITPVEGGPHAVKLTHPNNVRLPEDIVQAGQPEVEVEIEEVAPGVSNEVLQAMCGGMTVRAAIRAFFTTRGATPASVQDIAEATGKHGPTVQQTLSSRPEFVKSEGKGMYGAIPKYVTSGWARIDG